MQNLNYRLTGCITSAAALSFQKLLGYDPAIISQNATESFLPRRSDLFSYWLIEKDGRFWKTRFYPGEMMLASVANNQDEQMARNRVMAKYPDTALGRLQGLAEFTQAYIPALKEGTGLKQIGISIIQGSARQTVTQASDRGITSPDVAMLSDSDQPLVA
ncbi:MAG: hypothetical protein ACRCZS_08625 [Chroococcidiopsis sp.]